MAKRIYPFGIGSPKWAHDTGHVVNARGVPIPVRHVDRPDCHYCATGTARNVGVHNGPGGHLKVAF